MTDSSVNFVLDGNAAAGILQDLFLPEITTARIQCVRCESAAAVGALRLYAARMGAVLRCGACDNVLLSAVHTPHGWWLEMTGARSLKFDPVEPQYADVQAQ